MKILLLSGSFHSKSRSLAILDAIKALFPEHDYVLPALDQLPFYSEDLAAAKPDNVKNLIAQVSECDGILVVTPEYNHSIPAVLKNAIDWASRPAFVSPLKDKPVSFITQAVSAVGGARAQAHLKLIFDSTLSRMHMCHEMMIVSVDKVLDENRQVTDQDVLRRLKRHVAEFLSMVEVLSATDSTNNPSAK